MKKLNVTKNDVVPLTLLFVGLALLLIGILLKSLVVIAGVAGLVAAWFLSIDNLIANQKMNVIKRILFGSIIISLPFMFALYLGS